MHWAFLFLCFVLSLPGNCEIEEDLRVWTSANGKHTFRAELVEVKDELVLLRNDQGKVIEVEIDRLSTEDRDYLARRKKVGARSSSKPRLERSLRNRLSPFGVKMSGGELVLVKAKKLSQGVAGLDKSKKKVNEQSLLLGELLLQQEQVKASFDQLRILNVNLNARLANAASVRENNRLVGEINANTSRMELIQSGLDNLQADIQSHRAALSKTQEAFIQKVLGLRKESDALDVRIAELNAAPEFRSLLDEIKSATGNALSLGVAKSLQRTRAKLSEIEKTILSDTIPLRNAGSGTFYVTVSINGNPLEMVLDSGASIILLTQRNAEDLGITIPSDAPTVLMTIADGSQIPAKRIRLKEVRLGKFSVPNVDCSVLGPEAVNAEPLLGMSFLSSFKFELNAQESELTMVKVDSTKD